MQNRGNQKNFELVRFVAAEQEMVGKRAAGAVSEGRGRNQGLRESTAFP